MSKKGEMVSMVLVIVTLPVDWSIKIPEPATIDVTMPVKEEPLPLELNKPEVENPTRLLT